MAVETLRCRVCEAEYPAVASGSCSRCFGPLEPVYDWDELARTVTRQSIEAGPRSLWRYEALLPTAASPGWTSTHMRCESPSLAPIVLAICVSGSRLTPKRRS